MPAIAPKNYRAKIDEFAAHWPQVNTALGAPLVLTGNYGVAMLGTDRTALAAQITTIETQINANEAAISTRDTLRAALKERMRQFNQLVRGAFPRSQYERMLPRIPGFTAAPGIWMKAMADINNIWTQINAIFPIPVGAPVPLVLTGSYTLATFTTDQAALNAAFSSIESTENNVTSAIRQRDVLWKAIYQRLRQYRLAVQGRFATGSALLLSLPALSPPAGHTPDPVNASAVWDAVTEEAVVTYTASADPDLESYELRGSFGGTKYNTDTASVLGNHLPGDLTPFRTADGLVASGSKVYYKVYVVLDTGNEKGSKTVSVTRP
ncbi:MAG TPA: hypothetical protein PLH94_08885 [Fimbriimonadaceae bacterium]|nr:hypothetical protein [Fimbriimonadaceae bacterium]